MVNNEPNKKKRKPYVRINYNHFHLFRLVRGPNKPKTSNSYSKFKSLFWSINGLDLIRSTCHNSATTTWPVNLEQKCTWENQRRCSKTHGRKQRQARKPCARKLRPKPEGSNGQKPSKNATCQNFNHGHNKHFNGLLFLLRHPVNGKAWPRQTIKLIDESQTKHAVANVNNEQQTKLEHG